MNEQVKISGPSDKKITQSGIANELKVVDSHSNDGPGMAKIKTLNDFESYRITKEKFIQPTEAVISICDAPVAAAGNITPVTAEGKAGKTASTTAFLAGAISSDGKADGFDKVSVIPNTEGKAIIHFDTEQSEYDQQYNIKTILQRAGLTQTPSHFLSYNIRTVQMENYRQITTDICDLASKEFNGVHLIVIDGAADFISSVNDETEANSIIAFFVALSVKHNCPIIIIIHLNENASRTKDTIPRGHLGRQAVRKGYCQLNITREGEISTLRVLRARKAGSEIPTICFSYNHDKGYHTSVDPGFIREEREREKETQAKSNIEKISKKIFVPPKALAHKNAISQIMKETAKSESTAKRMLREMEVWEIIRKHEDGFYRINL